MKYILAFSLLFVETLAQAQSPAVPQAAIVVSSLSQLTSYPGSLTHAIWDDPLRGGPFTEVDTAGLSIDSGIVFPSHKTNKYWRRDITPTEAIHTRWYAAYGGLTDNTVLLQRAINSARGRLLNFDDSVYHIKGALDLQSHSKYNFNSRIVQDSTGDVNIITALKDTDFVITGLLKLEAYAPGSNCISDGVFFDSCSDFSIEHIICNGTRFGVQFGHCKNAKVGTIEGYDIKGFQGVPANGGSVFTFYCSSDIFVNYIYGERVWKAGVYFSITAEGIVNERIKINAVNFKMDTSNLANGVGLRSARNVDIGSIQVDGGMAGVYGQLNFDGQSVEDVHIGSLRVTNNTQVANVANALRISSSITQKIRRFSVDNLDVYNSIAPGILVLHAEDIHIGNVLIDSVAGDKGISLDDAKNVTIDNLVIKRTEGGIIINDSVANFKLGNFYFENIVASTSGILANTNPSFLGVMTNFSAGSITGYNDPARGAFAYIINYGAPPSLEALNIGQIKYTNGNGILWKGKVFSNISNKILWAGSAPSTNTNYWNYGDIIYNDSSTSQTLQGWRCYGGGFPGDWRRIDKLWGLDSVLAQNPSNNTRTVTFNSQSLNFENPLGSPSNKGIGFTDNNVTRFFLYREASGGALTLNEYTYTGSLIKTLIKIDSATGNIGMGGVLSPQQALHVNGNIRGDAFMGLNASGSYLQLTGQTSSPASSTGMILWGDNSSNLSWRSQGNTYIKRLLHTGITADRDWTLPNASGTFVLTVNGNAPSSTGDISISAISSSLNNGKFYVGNVGNVATAVTPTGDVTFDNAGVFAIGSSKVTNAMLANSSITIDNTSTSLGGSIDTRPKTVSTASDQTSTSTSPANITGLTYSCAAGVKYHAVIILWTECSTANGVKVFINLSGSGATLQSGTAVGTTTSVLLSRWARPNIAGTTIGTFNTVATTSPNGGMVRMEIFFTTVNIGTLNIQFAAFTGGDTATIDAGSTMLVEQTQ